MGKTRQVNIKNFCHVVPEWALGVSPAKVAYGFDGVLSSYADKRNVSRLKGKERTFWLEITKANGDLNLRVAEPDGGSGDGNAGYLVIDCDSPMGGWCQVSIPLYAILKGFPDLRGNHNLYLHEIEAEGRALRYFGITKQRWFDRLAQHVSATRSGSRLIFHEAIRRYPNARKIHKLFVAGCSYEAAMHEEESFVDEFSLYPKGLNMIPGGFAGLSYLGKLGFSPKDAKQRDDVIEALAQRETVEGKPNPLCAARWASDQDFVNRIVCGHSGRFTVDEVRSIRRLSEFGKTPDDIADILDVGNVRRVRNVIRGSRYSRVS